LGLLNNKLGLYLRKKVAFGNYEGVGKTEIADSQGRQRPKGNFTIKSAVRPQIKKAEGRLTRNHWIKQEHIQITTKNQEMTFI